MTLSFEIFLLFFLLFFPSPAFLFFSPRSRILKGFQSHPLYILCWMKGLLVNWSAQLFSVSFPPPKIFYFFGWLFFNWPLLTPFEDPLSIEKHTFSSWKNVFAQILKNILPFLFFFFCFSVFPSQSTVTHLLPSSFLPPQGFSLLFSFFFSSIANSPPNIYPSGLARYHN